MRLAALRPDSLDGWLGPWAPVIAIGIVVLASAVPAVINWRRRRKEERGALRNP